MGLVPLPGAIGEGSILCCKPPPALCLRYGGKGQKPVLHGWASCVDYLTGYSASFGAALALFKRKRSGKGDLAMTSLAQGAQLVQAPLMYATKTSRSGDEPQGQEARGEHALYGIYRASDGWLFLAGRKSDQSKLKMIPELSEFPVSDVSDEGQAQLLEEAIQKQPVDSWLKIFNDADLGCHRVDCLEDIRHAYLHQVNTDASVDEWDDGRSISVIRMMDHPIGNPGGYSLTDVCPVEECVHQIGTPQCRRLEAIRERFCWRWGIQTNRLMSGYPRVLSKNNFTISICRVNTT